MIHPTALSGSETRSIVLRPNESQALRAGQRLGALALSVLGTVGRWNERHAQRRMLMELDAHMLRDIGITSDVAYREGRKSFWQA
jgi:uncharacterized protein YjiS (DUF1127 family)